MSRRSSTGFTGAIFDIDGVLVESPHEQAWRETLERLLLGEWSDLRDETSWAPDAFTTGVYKERVSGKPRADGARAALEYFNIPDAAERVGRYADLKQQQIVELIGEGKFTAFADGLRFICDMREMGMSVAAASSSKNADLFLGRIDFAEFCRAAGRGSELAAQCPTLLDVFAANVSGRDFAQGKPHPEMFLTAADELGLEPEDCFVIEDAVSGIQAAKAAGMMGLGVARLDDEDELLQAGADVVVTSLDDVDRSSLAPTG